MERAFCMLRSVVVIHGIYFDSPHGTRPGQKIQEFNPLLQGAGRYSLKNKNGSLFLFTFLMMVMKSNPQARCLFSLRDDT
jgi:hypothetical protein